MARKVVVDLVDAVGTFMAKTNYMSDYLGDLDGLDSAFKDNYADSNFVSALNHLNHMIDSMFDRIFSDSADFRFHSVIGDSADFKRLRVGALIADSAVIDSAEIRNLDVDHLTVDSATIKRLTVSEAIIDSAYIDSATINDAFITNLIMNDSDGVAQELNNLKLFQIREESGGIVYQGYLLSTSNIIGTA